MSQNSRTLNNTSRTCAEDVLGGHESCPGLDHPAQKEDPAAAGGLRATRGWFK